MNRIKVIELHMSFKGRMDEYFKTNANKVITVWIVAVHWSDFFANNFSKPELRFNKWETWNLSPSIKFVVLTSSYIPHFKQIGEVAVQFFKNWHMSHMRVSRPTVIDAPSMNCMWGHHPLVVLVYACP